MLTTRPHRSYGLARDGDEAPSAQEVVIAAFQPLIDLRSGDVVAFEALMRGRLPPLELLAEARRAGRITDLDWAARMAALTDGLEAGSPSALFINVDPAAIASPPPTPAAAEAWAAAGLSGRVVVEITEHALATHPAELMHALADLRQAGFRLALDDVGARPASLALLPIVQPDVIKLDLKLLQRPFAAETAAVVSAVQAEAERSGAQVVAEGIETEENRRTALALGATIGQGWLFGRPGPVGDAAWADRRRAHWTVPPLAPPAVNGTPVDLVFPRHRPLRASKRYILAASRHLERWALSDDLNPIVLATFQEAPRFANATARLYERMAVGRPLVAALGVGMSDEPAPGVRGQAFGAADPLRGQWNVIVLGAHIAGALVAADLGDEGPDAERRFDFVITYDRALVVEAATALLKHVAPRTEAFT